MLTTVYYSFTYGFVSVLTLLYFAQLTATLCSYSLATILAISAVLEILSIYLVIDRCQYTLDKIQSVADTIEIHKKLGNINKTHVRQSYWYFDVATNILFDIFQMFSLTQYMEKMTEMVNASQYFYLDRKTFLAVNCGLICRSKWFS